MSDDHGSSDSGSASEALPQSRLLAGRYKLGRLVGEGGMGAVYEAEHTGLGARVAVKLLSEGAVLDQRAIRRFRREAKAMGAVRHDNVVTVMDADTDEDGVPFLVMEYLEGESLGALLRRERVLSPARAAGFTAQILSGLQAAHAQGIVHRDLKPGNIFVARQADGSQRLKILDFGVSKLGDTSQTMNVTADGVLVGTPNFMAPEQVEGRSDIDARVDLYAVGVMLYRMLTGKLPYVATSSEELYRRILMGEARRPRDVRPEISEELESVLLTGMAADRSQRYQDAVSFRAALQRALPTLLGDRSLMARSSPALPSPAEDAAEEEAAPEEEDDDTRAARPGSRKRAESPEGEEEKTRAWDGRRRRVSVIAAAATAVLLLAAGVYAMWLLTTRGEERAGAGREAEPEPEVTALAGPPLRFGVIRYMPEAQIRPRHQPLAGYLGERLDRPVDLVIAADHDDLRRRLLRGEVELAALSPYNYVRTRREEPGIKLLATPVAPGGASSYQGHILARAGSGIDALEDLEGKSFCYVDPGSSSGYLYPRAVMRRRGIDPDEHFKSRIFGGDHLNTLRLLARESCAGAAVYASILYSGAEHGLPPTSFRVLASTPRIPHDAYCAPASTPSEEAEAIRSALLALEAGGELARRTLVGTDSPVVGFVEARDEDFDAVREIEEFLDEPSAPSDGAADGPK